MEVSTILKANKLEDILDIHNFQHEYKLLMKQLHPDICKDPGAGEAVARINQWKEEFINGKKYQDEAGEVITNNYNITYQKNDLTELSLKNHKFLMSLKGDAAENFQKYLPELSQVVGDRIEYKFFKRAICLKDLVLDQVHVNWVLNRILEYSAYLQSIGYVHAGFNPENLYIIPENHQLQITNLYHLTKVGDKVKTISGKYKNWYPAKLFSDKIATNLIDTELAKRVAIYLLGDKSGVGIKLKKTHNTDFIDFTLRQDSDSYKAMIDYKEMLRKNFKSQFHILNL